MNRLGRTGVEYGDRSWNFFPGLNKPHLIPELLLAPLRVKKPSVILVNFMGDLFGDWIDPEMKINSKLEYFDKKQTKRWIVEDERATLGGVVQAIIKNCPQHQFLFLTKAPWNYKKWAPFPENAWIGATVWDEGSMIKALYSMTNGRLSYSKRLWLSVEPMYGPVVPGVWPAEWDEIGWVVIGAQSNPLKYPDVDWVEHLVVECIKAKKPVWLKDSLAKVLPPAIPYYVPPRDSITELGIPLGRSKIELLYRQERPF